MSLACPCQHQLVAKAMIVAMMMTLLIQVTMGFIASPPRVTSRPCYFRLYAINTDDPFRILNLEPDPSLDKKTIKRAYKRMALKFHPDVVTNKDSTPEEKKKASDDFAKINWAYETLSGKNGDAKTSTASGASAGTGYTPPHRRTSSYSSSGSTNWEDYMPKYDDADYDAGGDSFGAIFSDLFAGAAGAAAGAAVGGVMGGGGILNDLVDFLERNVDGYSGGAVDDAQLSVLLQTGSVQDIGMEMDDTELVVQQLSSKLDNIDQELMAVTAEAKVSARYLERLELEEAAEELKARKKVSEGYLKKARKRLLKLQSRYKELIVGGQDDFRTRDRASQRTTTTSSSWESGASTRTDTGRSAGTDKKDDEEAWKHEGFGSSGRGRGSSRRRSRSRRTAQRDTSASNDSFFERKAAEPSGRSSDSSYSSPGSGRSRTSSSSSSPRASPPSEPWTPPVPPHRRTSSAQSSARADKRRMRELQVEDDFEKLKKDLGL